MALASVRLAAPDDAAAIALVQRTVWTSAYADLLPPGAVEGFDEAAVAAGWAAPIAAGAVWVATEGDALVGFCAAGPASPDDLADAAGSVPDDAASVAAVATLLVEPRWGRRGHGGRLLVEAAAALREAGATRGIAWVPERDAASRRFFERAGWDPDGTVRTLDAGGRPLREIRVAGDLDLEFRPEPSLDDLDLPLLP
ncbi:GNAT family N-acetyltransferase [Actinomycetospora straminea]|uniref:GNAT family N-acetyltransferase n=1 Tax=Actinomycetospora straminea TaxID=663607 RepID=A0ABP9F6T2_9PSEU|nr:GNAT family N-acetyltransferase [Actinomycetospora straminea]MDD7931660.1 GNAT family N-acetyltransferase [Actinomycetospora straminea]